ncbi:uncharacterized protein [Onthophagus taurus]|uniref:uncharacterized protein n=1 Tax=Onthophagus taurus TaxID=166361 RepID=UPI0039BDE131
MVDKEDETRGSMRNIGIQHEFDPKNIEWTVHRGRLEQFFIANGIVEDRIKKAILINSLSQEPYKLVESYLMPKKLSDCPYADIISVLNKFYSKKNVIFAERHVFYAAKKDVYENVQSWAVRIKKLATNCEFEAFLETAMRDKFIVGIGDRKIIDRLFAEDDKLTFEKAVEIAELVESVLDGYGVAASEASGGVSRFKTEPVEEEILRLDQRWHRNRGRGKSERGGHGTRFTRGQSGRAYADTTPTSAGASSARGDIHGGGGAVRCYRCGNVNHRADRCKYKNYICNSCGKIGHLSAVCNSKRKVNYLDISLNNIKSNVELFKPIMVKITVLNKEYEFELDSGAGISVMSKDYWLNNFGHYHLYETNLRLVNYCGSELRMIGKIKL